MVSNTMYDIIKDMGFDAFSTCVSSIKMHLRRSTPWGEHWNIIIPFDGSDRGLMKEVYERSLSFNIDDEIDLLLPDRGKNGVPYSFENLLSDAKWKKVILEELAISLKRHVEELEMLEMGSKEVPASAIFFDMDGTLAEWNSNASIEEVMEPGYFTKRVPMMNMVNAAKLLIGRGHKVYITSKVFSGTTAVEDKNEWLDEYLPEITERFFIPYENRDKNAIPLEGGVKPGYVLVDDSTHHGLAGWAGIGVKVDNGINNTKRSWDGYMVSSQSTPEKIADTIEAIMLFEGNKNQREEKKPALSLDAPLV